MSVLKNFYVRVALAFCLVGALGLAIYWNQPAGSAKFMPDAVQWGNVPITVTWKKSDYTEYDGAILAAINTYNARLGCEVLRAVEGPADITIKPLDGLACDDGRPDTKSLKETLAVLYECGNHLLIQTVTIDEVHLAHRVFLHELGHALGLDHDTDVFSGMRTKVLPPLDTDPPEVFLVTDAQVKLLKPLYCNK